MQHINVQIAGTTTHPRIGTQVLEAKTFLLLRQRLQTIAQAATAAPHLRRPRKGNRKTAARWPSQITFQSLEL